MRQVLNRPWQVLNRPWQVLGLLCWLGLAFWVYSSGPVAPVVLKMEGLRLPANFTVRATYRPPFKLTIWDSRSRDVFADLEIGIRAVEAYDELKHCDHCSDDTRQFHTPAGEAHSGERGGSRPTFTAGLRRCIESNTANVTSAAVPVCAAGTASSQCSAFFRG